MNSFGSKCYRPPEVIEDYAKNLIAVDLYCIGVVLYGMVTGTFPFAEKVSFAGDQYLEDYHAFNHNPKSFWEHRKQ